MKFFSLKNGQKKGLALVTTLIFAAISIIIITGLIVLFTSLFKQGKYILNRERAFQIAESGIDYYRWHLAHTPTDYKDGTTNAGPYVHQFYDKDGNLIGSFTLTITPPPVGSTVVTIKSVGKVSEDANIKRTITTKLAKPSFAKYSIVSTADIRFGEGTEVFGPIHSNGGIRFDGLAHNLVTSVKSTYDDPDHNESGTDKQEFGVHTHDTNTGSGTTINDSYRSAEAPPNTVPSRTDVFAAGRLFPVPPANFVGITHDLSLMKNAATSSGVYFGASSRQGYLIILKTNDTFDIYKVATTTSAPNHCTNTQSQTGWGTWSVTTKVNPDTGIVNSPKNYPIPANGIIFAEDNVWVEGQISTARVTIVAANLDGSTNYKSITVNNDLKYTNYDGQDVIALIAQQDFNVGMYSDTDLRIDAAIVAQNGRVGRYYYENDCSPYDERNTLTLYGMIASNLRYGFAYTDGTGYDTRIITYDANLLYAPPPSFPLTSDFYQIISWEENEQ